MRTTRTSPASARDARTGTLGAWIGRGAAIAAVAFGTSCASIEPSPIERPPIEGTAGSGAGAARVLPAASPAGQDDASSPEHEPWREHPHHVSVVLAGTHSEGDEDAATVGVDYEYRVSDFLGVGFVAEHALHPLDATSLIATVDLHLWRGLAIQTGPGAVVSDDEEFFIYRFGALYEFEFEDGYTLSPQLHWDLAGSGEDDELIYGIAFGRAF